MGTKIIKPEKKPVIVLTKCNRYSYRGMVYHMGQPTEVTQGEARHLIETGYFREYTGAPVAKPVERQVRRRNREQLIAQRAERVSASPSEVAGVQLPPAAGTLEGDTDGAVEV